MGKFIVKKRISLEFLGEDYKEGFVVLSSIPMKDYDKLLDETNKIAGDEKKSLAFLQEKVKERFVEGKFPVDGELVDILKENLPELPAEFFVEAIEQLKGKLPPKA